MRRREAIAACGAVAVGWPMAVRAQPSTMPVIGSLSSSSSDTAAHLIAAFRRGLSEAGYVEGRNVTIDHRWGDGDNRLIPAMAADLVRQQVVAIVAFSTTVAGVDRAEAFRQLGIYTGRVLGGANPAELPVVQSTRFELAVNLRTARALRLSFPPAFLARADEVIE